MRVVRCFTRGFPRVFVMTLIITPPMLLVPPPPALQLRFTTIIASHVVTPPIISLPMIVLLALLVGVARFIVLTTFVTAASHIARRFVARWRSRLARAPFHRSELAASGCGVALRLRIGFAITAQKVLLGHALARHIGIIL